MLKSSSLAPSASFNSTTAARWGRTALASVVIGFLGSACSSPDDGDDTGTTMPSSTTTPTTTPTPGVTNPVAPMPAVPDNPGTGGMPGVGPGGACTPPARSTDGPSYAATVSPIFEAKCTATCHEPNGILGGPGGVDEVQMDLTAGAGYMALTEVPSTQLESMCIVGATVEESYLWHKLNNTHIEVGGEDARMPLTGDPLTADEMTIVRAWIEGGASP